MKVILFGSQQFTPTDLPSGVVLTRGSLESLWAGSTTAGYDNLAWRTSTDWSNGFYMRANLATGDWGSGPAILQDSVGTSGGDATMSWGKNKTILARVPATIPLSAIVSYVRLWIRAGSASLDSSGGYRQVGLTNVLTPYWQVIGSSGDTSTAIIGGATGFIGGTISSHSRLIDGLPGYTNFDISSSPKLTTSPYGGTFTGEVLRHTGWGVWLALGAPGNGQVFVTELGVEVGYDLGAYVVTTGGASAIGTTTATVAGTVDPAGDSSSSYWFEYGISSALGNSTTPGSFSTGVLTSVSANLSGLTAGTPYWYRLVAQSTAGTRYYGAMQSFLTGGGSALPIYVL